MALQILAIPIVGVIITAFLALFGFSIIATIFPAIGSIMFALIFLALAFVLPKMNLFKKGDFTLTLNALLVFCALGIFVMNYITNIRLPLFASSIMTGVGLGAIQTGGVQLFGVQAASATSIAITFVAVLVGALILNNTVYKKKKFLKGF
jgi:hypothetical protein